MEVLNVAQRLQAALHDNTLAIARDAVAASVADVSACIVRVPCDARLSYTLIGFNVVPKPLLLYQQGE